MNSEARKLRDVLDAFERELERLDSALRFLWWVLAVSLLGVLLAALALKV